MKRFLTTSSCSSMSGGERGQVPLYLTVGLRGYLSIVIPVDLAQQQESDYPKGGDAWGSFWSQNECQEMRSSKKKMVWMEIWGEIFGELMSSVGYSNLEWVGCQEKEKKNSCLKGGRILGSEAINETMVPEASWSRLIKKRIPFENRL